MAQFFLAAYGRIKKEMKWSKEGSKEGTVKLKGTSNWWFGKLSAYPSSLLWREVCPKLDHTQTLICTWFRWIRRWDLGLTEFIIFRWDFGFRVDARIMLDLGEC